MAASTKFVIPPTDGSIPPSSISDFHLEHNPSHVFAILYDINNSSQTNVTHEQLACAVHRELTLGYCFLPMQFSTL
ncbi:hypothetical protein AG1IA_00004 [Rhizoctonia solani AG-1 IA]|uniref:Uncharacterized protein n=1 Tax=Thanatephorus cucumeris (strain AG1-IA) TaxID=983506 RepID=L8XA75_THACA|nr:hypothetical protein AG1IA_00004 [Rhizoctonia solani AG-1 IA]